MAAVMPRAGADPPRATQMVTQHAARVPRASNAGRRSFHPGYAPPPPDEPKTLLRALRRAFRTVAESCRESLAKEREQWLVLGQQLRKRPRLLVLPLLILGATLSAGLVSVRYAADEATSVEQGRATSLLTSVSTVRARAAPPAPLRRCRGTASLNRVPWPDRLSPR